MKKILLVEDDRSIRTVMAERLKKTFPDLAILCCEDAPSAMKAWDKNDRDIVLVITDGDYPGGGAMRLLQHIHDAPMYQKAAVSLQVMLLTGSNLLDWVQREGNEKAVVFGGSLSDPKSEKLMEIALTRLIEGKTGVRPLWIYGFQKPPMPDFFENAKRWLEPFLVEPGQASEPMLKSGPRRKQGAGKAFPLEKLRAG
ncbi:MAG: response regulator [Alphaproteobacteria bacterium]|nr:response regulator [Alphaproteobacteria bacterium]